MKLIPRFIIIYLLTTGLAYAQWSPIADYPGSATTSGIGFTVNGRIYAGMGANSGQLFEYLPESDTWEKRADCPGGARAWAVAFTINGVAYVGTGTADGAFDMRDDLWAYHPDTDTWEQKASFALGKRAGMWSFVVDGKAFVGGGYDQIGIYIDASKYDPETDTWEYLGYWPGGEVRLAAAFALNGKGYVGTGASGAFGSELNVFYEYNPKTNEWKRMADFPGGGRQGVAAFTANGKGYFAGGQGSRSPVIMYRDIYEYDPGQDEWTKVLNADLPTDYSSWAVAMESMNMVYLGYGTKHPGFEGTADMYKRSFGTYLRATVHPGPLDYGTLRYGATRDSIISFENAGHENVSITNIDITGDGAAVYSTTHAALPIELAPGASTEVIVHFSPDKAQTFNATLTVSSTANSGAQIAYSLVGVGREPIPLISLDTDNIDFGSLDEGAKSTMPIVISNSGEADLIVTEIQEDNDFSDVFDIPTITFPLTIVAGSSESVGVRFAPEKAGTFTARLTVLSNAGNGDDKTVALFGVAGAVERTIQVSSTLVNIDGVEVGTYSEETIQISSTGEGSVTLTKLSIENDPDGYFSFIADDTPLTIESGESADLKVRFTPGSAGTFSSVLKIQSNADNDPSITVNLTGVSFEPQASAISVDPESIAFNAIEPGQETEMQFTINSIGAVKLRVEDVTIEDDASNVFEIRKYTPPTSLLPGGSKSITVAFTPDKAGDYTARIHIVSDAAAKPDVYINLTGKAALPDEPGIAFNVSGIDFGTIAENTVAAREFEIESSGTGDLVVSQLGVSNDPDQVFQVSGITIPETIPAGEKRTITVEFSPSSPGSYSGMIAIQSNVTGSELIEIPVNGAAEIETSVDNPALVSHPTIQIYPNPVQVGDVLNVHFSAEYSVRGTFAMYDIFGREVERTQAHEFKPGANALQRISEHPAGTYFLRYSLGTTTGVLRLNLIAQ